MPAVLITGAGSGMGRAAALQLAQLGWDCWLADRSPVIAQVQQQCLQLGAPQAQAFQLDLCDAQARAQMCSQLPLLDALVNNAGISDSSGIALVEQTPEQLALLLRLNLEVPQRLFEACVRRLRPGARVVNVASGAGLKAIPWRGLYSPSKAGLIALTKGLAQAWPQFALSVLCPGFVRTELVQGLIDSGRLVLAEAVAKIPLGRLAEPQEMAAAIVFLAQAPARVLSGQVLSVDGGSSVYGGSRPCGLSQMPLAEQGAALQLQALEPGESRWSSLAVPAAQTNAAYQAVFSTAACQAQRSASLADTVLAAARQFRAAHPRNASLLVLLPVGDANDWQFQTELATARMLVATLACEWGADALRINALLVADSTAVAAEQPLVHFLSGAQAQFITGQTLDVSAAQGENHGH